MRDLAIFTLLAIIKAYPFFPHNFKSKHNLTFITDNEK